MAEIGFVPPLPKRLTRINSNIVEDYEYNNTNSNIRNILIVNLNNPFSLYPHLYHSTRNKLKDKNKELKTDTLLFFKSTGTSNPRFGGLYKGLWLPTLGTAIKYHHAFKKKHHYIIKMESPNLAYMIDNMYIQSYREYKALDIFFKKKTGTPYLQNLISIPEINREVTIDEIMTELLTYCQTWNMLKLCVELNTNPKFQEFQTPNNLFTQPGMEEFINDVKLLKQCGTKICGPKDKIVDITNKEFDSLKIVDVKEMNQESKQVHIISQKNINMFREIIGKDVFNTRGTGILPIKCNETECVILEPLSPMAAEALPPMAAEALPPPPPHMAAEALPPTNLSSRKTRGKSSSRKANKKNNNSRKTRGKSSSRKANKKNNNSKTNQSTTQLGRRVTRSQTKTSS